MRYTRSEIGSLKGRTGKYREKALNGDCKPGEHERALKDGRRAAAILQKGNPSPEEARDLEEAIENAIEVDQAMSSRAPDHEFGVPGGWL